MKKALMLVLALMSLVLFAASTARVQATGVTVGTVYIHSTAAANTQVEIVLNIPGAYSATLNSGHCDEGDKLRYSLAPVAGGSSTTLLNASYNDVVRDSWHVTLLPSGTTGNGDRLCGDSRDMMPDATYTVTTGMPGTDGPIRGSSIPVTGMPVTGNSNGPDVIALLALALGLLTLGVLTSGVRTLGTILSRGKP